MMILRTARDFYQQHGIKCKLQAIVKHEGRYIFISLHY